MSEEIKEILDRIETASEIFDCLLKPEECKLLLNYITNLQQEIEQLEEENKELNRMCELYSQSLYNADLTKAEKKVEQLENIRKEAIEYIENNSYFESNIVKTMVLGDYSSDLLNMLNKGSDKDGNNTNETSTGKTEK